MWEDPSRSSHYEDHPILSRDVRGQSHLSAATDRRNKGGHVTTSQALTTSFPSLSSIEFEWKYQHPLQLPNFIFFGKVGSTLRRRERPLWCPNTRERESLEVMGRIICSSGRVRARKKGQKHSGLVSESRKWKKLVASASFAMSGSS